MKILYVITRAERGGGQVHVSDLLFGFRNNNEVELAIGEEGYLADTARRASVPVHILNHLCQPMAPLEDVSAVMECVTLFGRVKPDVVHAHTSKAGLVARLAGAITRTPVVFTAHTWSFAEGTSRRQRAICTPIERLCAGLSARIITVSEANRQCAIEAGVAQGGQMETVWNGIPDVTARAAPGAGSPVRVAMVARFADQKDQSLLLRAAAHHSDLHFEMDFIGAGPTLESVRCLTSELSLSHRVGFLGDRDDVPIILSRAHVFVLSTKWEGLPLSIIEAMRAGLPVIASNVGGVSELVKDGVTGFLVEAGDKVALANALRKLVVNPELRAGFGLEGRRRYEACFSVETMLERTNQIYTRAAGRCIVEGRPGRLFGSR